MTLANRHYGRLRRRKQVTFLLLVLPALLWFLLFMLWPLFNIFYISAMDWDGLARPQEFVGLGNFSRLLGDRNFAVALRNTGTHLVVVLPTVMPLAFMLGFFLSLRRPGYRLLRTIFFSPAMISVAALAMIFMGIYLPDGILNSLLQAVGLGSLARAWLGNASTALGAVIAIDIWGGIGFYGVLFFAALAAIPHDLYEAARLDGADYWTIMWRVAFPLTLDFFGVVLTLQFLWILSGAAQNVLLLTRGGPGNATLTLGYYLYELAFLSQRLGYSQALGVVIFTVGIAGILIIRRVTARFSDAERRP
jgi:multiple sugar transport system permease protein